MAKTSNKHNNVGNCQAHRSVKPLALKYQTRAFFPNDIGTDGGTDADVLGNGLTLNVVTTQEF